MQYWRSAAVTSFILIVVIFSASCGGGHSNRVGPISAITLTPNPTVSLNAGDVIQLTANATDAAGHLVTTQTFTFKSDNTTAVQISNPVLNGSTGVLSAALICAGGAWQNPANPIVCAPPNGQSTFSSGQANITVTAEGVTSNAVAVSVHPKVARVVVTPPNPACVAQGGSTTYSAQAFDIAGNDITAQVGTFTWSVADSTIGSLGTTTTTGTSPANSVFASLPGSTTVTATVNIINPVNSVAAVFQECPVANITITPNPNVFSPSPAAAATTQQMTAVVTDTNGNNVNNVPLTWSSSQPLAATVGSTGLVTAVAAGTSSITASCALGGGCNKNQNSLLTSNTAVASVSGSSATGIIVYAANSGSTLLVPIDTGSNTAQTAIPLPSTPNTLVFDNTGTVGYLGSDGGLMVLNPSNNSLTKTVTNAPGQVLAVSPNGGQFVILGGKLANGTGPFTQTLLFNNSNNAVTALSITNAVAADFSPDGSEAVVADTTGVRTVQGIAVRTVSTTVAGSVSFLANGALAYLAAGGAPSVIACNSLLHPGIAGTPKLVKTLPDGSKMLAAAPPNSLQVIAVSISGNSCPPTIGEAVTSLTFPSSATAQNQIIVTPDGSHAYFPSDVAGSLLSFNGTATGSVPLSSGTAKTTTGGATLDSASVYVGVNDGGNGSVHQISVSGGNDAAQIPLSFIPDLVAVRPH